MTFKEAIKKSPKKKAVFYSGLSGVVCDENGDCKPIFLGKYNLKVSEIEELWLRSKGSWQSHEGVI